MKEELGPTRLFPWLLLALSALLYLSDLSGRDLWEPNEPTYAEAAREMVRRNDWLLPTVNGETYPDKPPLLFWGIEAASRAEGKVTETTARLPSALAGLSLVLAVYLLSRRVLGASGALLSAGTLAVSSLFVEQARYVQTDMLLSLGVSLGILSLFRVMDGDAPRAGWVALASLGMTVGILAKGPVALALPILVIAADCLFEWGAARRAPWLLLATLLALPLPILYYLELIREHGTVIFNEFILRHNVERFVAGFDNLQPWWFYLKRLPVDLLPLTFLLPAAILLRPSDPWRRRFHRRLVVWLGVLLIFFSLSTSKRPVYMLPAFPAAALLCGSLLAATDWRTRPTTRRLALLGNASALLALAVAGIAAPFVARREAPDITGIAGVLALLAVGGAVWGFRQLARQRYLAVQATLVATLAGIWMISIYYVYPDANQLNSPRFFAEEVHDLVRPDFPLDSYGLYRWRAGYIFYADRTMPRLHDASAVERFLESGERVFCILPTERLPLLREELRAPMYVVAAGRTGHNQDSLISNRPPVQSPPSSSDSR